jgi:uncharacterized membrane protein YdjX (TVP38/TMEM64 family)
VKKYLIRVLVLLLLAAALFALVRYTPLGNILNIANLEANKEKLAGVVSGQPLLSGLLFILLYIAVVGLSIPGASLLSILGGFFFGVLRATLYINAGASVGALLVFLAARFFLGEMIQEKYAERLRRFNEELEKNGRNYLLTLRFIAVFPFWMINLLAGVTRIRPWTFLWTTSLGIIPGSAAYAYSGYALARLGREPGFPPQLILAFVFLAALSLLPVVIKKIRQRRVSDGASGIPPA